MKMLVPNTKTELILLVPWTFRLYDERRNDTLVKNLGTSFAPPTQQLGMTGYGGYRYYRDEKSRPYQTVTLPAGTVLRTSRVYIRQGTADSYDSITFTIKETSLKGPTNKKVTGRFWAKLGDINGKMDAEVYLGKDHHVLPEQERVSRFSLLFAD